MTFDSETYFRRRRADARWRKWMVAVIVILTFIDNVGYPECHTSGFDLTLPLIFQIAACITSYNYTVLDFGNYERIFKVVPGKTNWLQV